MPLLTFSGSVAKGAAKTMTLNKSAITSMASISGDAYWSDATNIRAAVVMYESLTGSQTKLLRFDFTQSSPTDDLMISSQGRDDWKVVQVTLFDFDGGTFVLPEAVLEAQISGGISGLGLSLGGGGGSVPSSFTGDATTLGFYGSAGDPSLPPGATPSTNTLSWSVTGGVMTMSYDLYYNGTIIGGSRGSGTYGVKLPTGYAFAPSVTEGTDLGPAGFIGNAYNAANSGTPRAGASNTITINVPAGGGLWSNTIVGFVFGSTDTGLLRLTFNAAFAVITV